MYEINSESESLMRHAYLSFDRKGQQTIFFTLSEVIAPEAAEKYLAYPRQRLDGNNPKKEYIVRGGDETEVVNQFLKLTRDIENTRDMFKDLGETEKIN